MKQKGKKVGIFADVINKIKYSFQGIIYCYTHETSFIFEAIAFVLAIIMNTILQVKPHQWVFSLVSLLLITEIEFLNTAIEAVVDLVTDKYHPLAKIAKDCGSAATFMATLVAVIVHFYIYVVPYLPFIK
ncbi:MAG: diacylglycerol kinase [Mollicutes bacterium]|nr:diacylglycerol kinase [Mollicutes bacterium]